MITITCDKNCNLKSLKRLERANKIEIHAVSIEGIEDSSKYTNQEQPIAIIGGKFGLIGKSVIAANDTLFEDIEEIIGKNNHGDCLHLERHIRSGRDVFVTDDKDFLSCREILAEAFGVKILTVDQLVSDLE